MTLPKIEHPMYSIKLPDHKKPFNFRPFLVKEEKILLIAKESQSKSDIMRAIKQIVGNCSLDKNLLIDDLTTTELQFLFIRLWGLSVNNIVKQSYIDSEDNELYEFAIDLNKIEIKKDKIIDPIVKITNSIGVILRYPRAAIYENGDDETLTIEIIDKIFDGDDILNANNYSRNELIEFIDNLTIPAMNAIEEFIKNAPRLNYVIEYKNKLGNNRSIVLESIYDFFTFY
jgi:hypothetical protein